MPVNPTPLLTESLRAVRMTDPAADLFTRWPHLQFASLRLVHLLTRAWPDPNHPQRPLLDTCLSHSIAMAAAAFESHGDRAERDAFVAAMGDTLVWILHGRMACNTRRGTRIYEPLSTTLVEFIDLHRPATLLWSPEHHPAATKRNAKILCMNRVFTLSDLDRLGYLDDSSC